MKNNLFVLFLLLLISSKSFGQSVTEPTRQASQIDRYFVYFSDKSSTSYPYSLSSPSSFLTQRALSRRQKQGIAVDNSDLPVAPSYVQGLRDAGAEVYFTSKWLNGALVNLDKTLFEKVKALTFVDRLTLIAKETTLSNKKNSIDPPTSFIEPAKVFGNSDFQLKMLGVDQMHLDKIKGQGMLIAVCDSGFKGVAKYTPFQHLWENDRIIATRDFVANSGNVFQFGTHGTSVLSTIASKYDGGKGRIYGVANEAKFILCVTEENGFENIVEEYNLLLGAEFADSLGADVINISLGYRTFDIPSHNHLFEDFDGETTVATKAAKWAGEKGIIVAASAGNSGNDAYKNISAPADAKGILTVGSVNPNLTYTYFSSIGNTADGRIKPDVVALGFGTTIVNDVGVVRGNGTSFSSPLIAGFAACIWQLNPEKTAKEIIFLIKKFSSNTNNPNSFIGYGIPNYGAIKEGKALSVSDILKDKVLVYPNPFDGNRLYLKTEGKFKRGMNIKIIDPKGSLIYEKRFKKKEIKENMELIINGVGQGVYFLFLQTGKNKKTVKLISL